MQNLWLFIQTQWSLSLALLVVLLLIGCVELIRQQRQEKTLSVLKLIQLLNREQAVIIDLRDAAVYAAAHIIGAVSLPYVDTAKELWQLYDKKLAQLRGKAVVLVCAKGVVSLKIAPQLRKHDFQVQVLDGGMQAWLAAEMPVITAKDPSKNITKLKD